MSTKTNLLKIAQMIRETPDSVTVQFLLPQELKETFKYKPGQYITLVFDIKGQEERRAYSMSSSPNDEYLSVTVKKIAKGLVSSYINDELKVGQEVSVLPPQGHFFAELNAENNKCYVLFGAGSGITPLMSIIKTVLADEPQSKLVLIYGNRTEERIIFKKQLDDLVNQYPERLKIDYYLSAPPKSKGLKSFFGKKKKLWEGGEGRINEQVINRFLKENDCIQRPSEYFICGPGEMIDAVEKALHGKGVNEKGIHFERFTAAKKKVDTGEVVDNATLIVHLDDEKIELKIPKGKTVLDVLLKNNVDAPFACKAGVCSSCIAKVKQGEVVMGTCDALDEDEIKHGYILACQARPLTDVLEVDFDDL